MRFDQFSVWVLILRQDSPPPLAAAGLIRDLDVLPDDDAGTSGCVVRHLRAQWRTHVVAVPGSSCRRSIRCSSTDTPSPY